MADFWCINREHHNGRGTVCLEERRTCTLRQLLLCLCREWSTELALLSLLFLAFLVLLFGARQ